MDHYQVLHVRRDADPAVIEKAYKALSMKYHPDRLPAEARSEANRRMQRINEAYEVLRDPRRRRAYDRMLPSEGASGSGWERFLEDGLLGLFEDWRRTRI